MFTGIPTERIKEYKEAFEIFDKNKDGNITAYELANVMKSLNMDPTEDELLEMINEVDLDGNGEIDFEEFVTLMNRRSKETDTEEDVISAFKMFDRGMLGKISVTELRQIMKEYNEEYSNEELDEMLREADTDMDGYIDYEDIIGKLFDTK